MLPATKHFPQQGITLLLATSTQLATNLWKLNPIMDKIVVKQLQKECNANRAEDDGSNIIFLLVCVFLFKSHSHQTNISSRYPAISFSCLYMHA